MRRGAHRYNAQYSARLEGWEAARVRDLAAHTEKARHAFSSAGGEALARDLVEKACSMHLLLSCKTSCTIAECALCQQTSSQVDQSKTSEGRSVTCT